MPGDGRILDVVGIDELLARAGLCLTGEGKVDASTLAGKAPAAVVEAVVVALVPCVVLVGQVTAGVGDRLCARGAAQVLPQREERIQDAVRTAAADLAAGTTRICRETSL